MLNLKQIELRVRRLLDEHGILKPPVPVKKIGRELKVEIHTEPHEGNVSGALYRREGLHIIGVNRLHSPTRRRFTIAHELGHLLLHNEKVHMDYYYPGEYHAGLEKTTEQFFRNIVSEQASDPREIEANRFAAALLMPAHFLLTDFTEMNIKPPISAELLKKLSLRYKVSIQAITFRLANLGVPIETA